MRDVVHNWHNARKVSDVAKIGSAACVKALDKPQNRAAISIRAFRVVSVTIYGLSRGLAFLVVSGGLPAN